MDYQFYFPFVMDSSLTERTFGLTATPLLQTAQDVLRWDVERGRPPLSVGLSREQEDELLA